MLCTGIFEALDIVCIILKVLVHILTVTRSVLDKVLWWPDNSMAIHLYRYAHKYKLADGIVRSGLRETSCLEFFSAPA